MLVPVTASWRTSLAEPEMSEAPLAGAFFSQPAIRRSAHVAEGPRMASLMSSKDASIRGCCQHVTRYHSCPCLRDPPSLSGRLPPDHQFRKWGPAPADSCLAPCH
jgi:hypothetical protein